MHRKFLGNLGKSTGIAIVAIALSGCVQATRHSNTMVFGTSTSVGVKVGTDTAQIPAVEIGYNRQEMVIMPLLANIGEAGANSNRLTPCNPTFKVPSTGGDGVQSVTTVTNANNSIHPCQFVASRREGGNVSSQDSYSVLASFGAEIQGNATRQEGGVGLAQYFATGVAAQLLAASGGAAVVAVGGAAAAAASNEANAAAAAAVVGADAFPVGSGRQLEQSMNQLLALIRGTPAGADRKTKITTLYSALRPSQNNTSDAANECEHSVERCEAQVIGDAPDLMDTSNFGAQVNNWSSS